MNMRGGEVANKLRGDMSRELIDQSVVAYTPVDWW